MDTFLSLLLLSAACAATKVENNTVEGSRNSTKPAHEDPLDKLTEDDSPHVAAPTLGSLLVVVLLVLMIYYYCCHKKEPEEGFTQLEEENGPPRNKRFRRWRNRGFPRRNRRNNYPPNPPEAPHHAPHTTHVVIQPVVAVGIPTDNLHTTGTAIPNMNPTAPPPYDGGMNNHRYFQGDNIPQATANPPSYFTKY